MTATEPQRIRLFATDLDGTLLGALPALCRFGAAWSRLPSEQRPRLVYNSGRSVSDIASLIVAGRLPEPDYVIGSVGTELFDWRRRSAVRRFEAHFAKGWDPVGIAAVMRSVPGADPQPPENRHGFKSSWCLRDADGAALQQLRLRFRAAGLPVNLVYSSNRDLDVLPLGADKGAALSWLCGELAVPLEQVLVAGDTGNDSAMFRLPGVTGVLVANALAELRDAVVGCRVIDTQGRMADGVLEGLEHVNVLPR